MIVPTISPTRLSSSPTSPTGLIAFSFFNPAPQRQIYEIHLINANGTEHRLFPLEGVSEPALRWTGQDHQLAYRAWSEPTAPRSLLSGSLDGRQINQVGGFWEDAQPDWSPTEDRLIYASQREADRRWRLYTSRGDGSDEVDLRREGHGPTFAPDGRRFAFIGCDLTGNNCGLWQTDVDRANLPSGAALILVNEKAASPDWSPTGEQIAYMANINGNWDLYLVNSDGRNARRLTTDRAIDGLPAWSPDGGWLAFLSNRGNNWGIWLLHLDSGETGQIFAFDGGIFTPPHREPYGERNWEDEQLSWSQ
jgi:TolB protein